MCSLVSIRIRPMAAVFLRGGTILPRFGFDSSLVLTSVRCKQTVGFTLCWTIRIWIIQQILNAHQYLLDGNGRAPTFFFIQNG